MEVRIVPALDYHADTLAWAMRKHEKEEVRAMGYNPRQAIGFCMDSAVESWAVMLDDELMAMFGVIPIVATMRQGNLWLLTGHLVDKHPVTFARLCRRILPDLLVSWRTLTVSVHEPYAAAYSWASRLGFKLDGRELNDVTGEPFLMLTKVA